MVGVEPGGHEHDVGTEHLHRRLDHITEGTLVGVLGRPGGERHVERRPEGVALAALRQIAGSGIPGVLVERHVQHRRVVQKISCVPFP